MQPSERLAAKVVSEPSLSDAARRTNVGLYHCNEVSRLTDHAVQL